MKHLAISIDAEDLDPIEQHGNATRPWLFACPHSGRLYPQSLIDAAAADGAAFRSLEDPFVDHLIDFGPDLGAHVILARIARAYCDANRDPRELDPLLLTGRAGLELLDTPRVRAGFGVTPRLSAAGRALYKARQDAEVWQTRIRRTHQPYHAALKAAITAARARFPEVVLLDWHSMPKSATRTLPMPEPEIVLGDAHGLACGPEITAAVEQALRQQGFLVGRNMPFAGGYTTQTYGRPENGVHALQIELRRDLYFNEALHQPLPEFDAVKARLRAAAESFMTAV